MFVIQDEGNRKIVLDSSQKMTFKFVAAASALGKSAKLCTASEIARDSSIMFQKRARAWRQGLGHLRRRRAVTGDVISEPPLFTPSCDTNCYVPHKCAILFGCLVEQPLTFCSPLCLSFPPLLILTISLGPFCHVKVRGRSWGGAYFVKGVVDVVSQGRSLSDAYYDLV
jgi:hypothetical protein